MTLANTNPNEAVDITDVFKSKKLTAFRKDVLASQRQRATDIIQHRMPTNISRVQAILGAAEADASHPLHADQVKKEPYLKAVLHRTGPVEDDEVAGEAQGTGRRYMDHLASNENQRAVIAILERESEDLYFVVQELRMWLSLEVPVIEDGNSFGTEVQEHMMDNLIEACKTANQMKNNQRSHHNDRQKLASEWAAHPNIEDYGYSIASSDRLDHFLARSHMNNILRSYTMLLHKMATNWAKITEPKGQTNNGGMY